MIRLDKKYQTRGGREVRVLCLDKKHATYPVLALVTDRHGGEVICSFSECGKYSFRDGVSSYDLIEIKPRIKRSCWVNVYPDYISNPCTSKAYADDLAYGGRLACVEITIDCEHGEGL